MQPGDIRLLPVRVVDTHDVQNIVVEDVAGDRFRLGVIAAASLVDVAAWRARPAPPPERDLRDEDTTPEAAAVEAAEPGRAADVESHG